MAPYYRALWPEALPSDVDAMRPSQLAAVLGFDEMDAIRPVPFPDELVGEAERVERELGAVVPSAVERKQLRLRRVIGAEDA